MNPSTRTLILSVSQYWKGFDLDSKRVMLDAQGVSMQEQKENCLKSRKALAEHTKKFRKLADADKLPAIAALLRAYQEEIDTLTKRAKFSDGAFFALYKALYEAPDPVPALDAVEQVLSSAKAERDDSGGDDVKRLRKELAAYEAEFATLKNQDITIRNLEGKLQAMDDSLDRLVDDQVQARCRDIEATLRLREGRRSPHVHVVLITSASTEDIALTHAQHDKNLAQARQDREDALAQLDCMRSELFAAKQRHDHLQSAHAAETQGFVLEMERLRTVQVENQVLKRKLDATLTTPLSPTATTSTSSLTLELELAQKDADLMAAQRALHHAQESHAQLQQQWTTRVAGLEAELASARAAADELQRQVQEQREAQPTSCMQSPRHDATQTAAALAQELAAMQQQWQQLHAAHGQLAAQAHAQDATIAHQRAVIAQLEASLDDEPPNHSNNILGDVLVDERDTKLLSIMRQQRDRLKEKLKEMEGELHGAHAAKQQLTARLKQLEHENVDLVQKVRYVSTSTGATPDVEGGLSKYHTSMYEERLNPFDQFRQMESAARVAQLNPLDKVLLVSARLILSHPYTRMGLLAYLVVLHSLVVLTLYMSMHLCNVSNHT
ncbi:Aste57867_4969 [Aphanomyces stellatus]|uniref:Protein CASP n=1 Tax=Aphanomyces stellatus TaxID=120398 RepID=A0A485KCM5_9STRA|nr:hypothetical protein As57867_004956 [Aphanomyces stellatus]VFT82057.1 Aste57867_4969 [Aphanomyces stellatus]